jgi:hypothetical protein
VEEAGKYGLFLDTFPNLSLNPIDRSVLNQAARLRARYPMDTGCHYFCNGRDARCDAGSHQCSGVEKGGGDRSGLFRGLGVGET